MEKKHADCKKLREIKVTLSKALWTKIGIAVVKQQLLKFSQIANAGYNPSLSVHSLIRTFKKCNR